MSSLQEVLAFANQNSVSWVSTTENGNPHVRGAMMWYADETGFYYHTGSFKAFGKQLLNSPKTEIAFYNAETNKMMRIAGDVKFVEDSALEEKLLDERPFLKALKAEKNDSKLLIFKVVNGEAWFRTMETTSNPNVPRISF